MKVLHIISSGGMYGAEAVILNMSRTLNNSGLASQRAGGFLQCLESEHSTAREGAGGGDTEQASLISCDGQMDRRAIARIRELATETHADVVHAHGFKADIYVYLALHQVRRYRSSQRAIPGMTTTLVVFLYGVARWFYCAEVCAGCGCLGRSKTQVV